MRSLAVAVTLIFCVVTFSIAGEAIYTWKDEQGVLNITDAPPPAGAVVLDVSPVPHDPVRKNKKKSAQQVVPPSPSQVTISPEKQRLLDQAAAYRKQEEEAYQRGVALQAEIEEWQAKSGTKRKRRRNNRKIKKFNERFIAVNNEIETAATKAEELEKKAAAMQ